jgi:predicted DNA-binding protein (MmcQ/YjbR family)
MVRPRAGAPRKKASVTSRRFTAEVQEGHKGVALVLPFDPSVAWGERRRHVVRGSLNGVAFEGEVATRRRVHYALVDDVLLRHAKLEPGATADVVMSPREPRSFETGAPPKLVRLRRAVDVAQEIHRAICLSLPDTKETLTWGAPHFRIGEKIFSGFGEEKGGRTAISFKLEMPHAHFLVEDDARFRRAPYVGNKGWVSMDATQIGDEAELRAFLLESYRLIAPKRTVAKLATHTVPGTSSPRAARSKARSRSRK